MASKRPADSDEEDDYMSEAFLKSLEKQDVRPGLAFNKTQERQHALEKKRKETMVKPRAQLEVEVRAEGLSKPLDASNKGFQMLKLMGFQSSSSEAAVKMRNTEPINVELKSDKLGLGTKTEMKERLEERLKVMKDGQISESSYRENVRTKFLSNVQLKDLFKSQKCCYQLDSADKIEIPNERWFWPRLAREPIEGGEDQVDPEQDLEHEDTEDKLSTLTTYLRQKYHYCVWCGTKFDCPEDIEQSCPGSTRDDHDE